MSLKGSVQSIANFTQALRKIKTVTAQKIAEKAAEKITEIGKRAFEAGQDPYGNDWTPGADGDAVTLKKTGALERTLRYVANGTKIRVALTVPYAKYQIGKRPVFPKQGGTLPAEYTETLQRVAVDVIKQEIADAQK